MKKEVLKNWLILKRFICLTYPQFYKRMETLKNWLRLATVFVCVMFALVLLMAEPNECGSMAKWYGLFVATKVGSLACGFVAFIEVEKLTEEVKK